VTSLYWTRKDLSQMRLFFGWEASLDPLEGLWHDILVRDHLSVPPPLQVHPLPDLPPLAVVPDTRRKCSRCLKPITNPYNADAWCDPCIDRVAAAWKTIASRRG
jgi:hypothetical protein